MNILVICLGNVNRSPLVAGLLQREYAQRDFAVRSAGLLPGGRRAAPKARVFARSMGFSLEQHRSVQVTKEMVQWADVVVGFTNKHRDRLMVQVGVGGVYVRAWVNLAHYLSPPKKSIADPAFNGKEFDRIAQECCIALQNWMESRGLLN